ncbi:hypothetical protein Tco_0261991 [Tanacetum coccineum]
MMVNVLWLGLRYVLCCFRTRSSKEVIGVINTAKLIIDVAQVSAATTVSTATTTTATIKTVDDITLAQALKEMKSTKPKKKGIEKGKGVLIEPVKPMKKKDLIRLDEETALNLQAEFDEEERLAREKAEKEEEAIFLDRNRDEYRQRLMLTINWLKECKHKNKKNLLLKKRLHYFNNSYKRKEERHLQLKRAEEKIRINPPTKWLNREI